MNIDYELIKFYVLLLGGFLLIIGFLEFLFPNRAFRSWESWVSHRMFYLHGILLIAAGFPLTVYRGAFSSIIFFIGLFMVLSGPFILFYPEKIKGSFRSLQDELVEKGIKKIMFFDAAMRLAAGSLMITAFFYG